MNTPQDIPLVVCPFTGVRYVELYYAQELREAYPERIWLFHPWHGVRRTVEDVHTDPVGQAILQPEHLAPQEAMRARLSQGRRVEDRTPLILMRYAEATHKAVPIERRKNVRRSEDHPL